MNPDTVESRRARQTVKRRSHTIWRGIFIYSITCNLTIILTLLFTRREVNQDSYPIVSTMVAGLYLFSEIFLLLFSPFFIRRFGALATLGLSVALINFALILSISGRS
jgi:membrane-associated HD superfamily phosphohydrolase